MRIGMLKREVIAAALETHTHTMDGQGMTHHTSGPYSHWWHVVMSSAPD
jgi:hypothetical protein